MSFDPRCYDLAAIFLSDEPTEVNTEKNRNHLAQVIQTAIEDAIEFEMEVAEPSK